MNSSKFVVKSRERRERGGEKRERGGERREREEGRGGEGRGGKSRREKRRRMFIPFFHIKLCLHNFYQCLFRRRGQVPGTC